MNMKILPTDHVHVGTYDETCSRCRKAIGEDEVPLLMWLPPDGDRMLAYCNACDPMAGSVSPLDELWEEAVETGKPVDIGDMVVCDGCNRDYTGQPDPGGLVFGDKGIGPCCAPKWEASIRRYGEESHIKVRCPEGKPFAKWVCEDLRKTGSTIQVTWLDRSGT